MAITKCNLNTVAEKGWIINALSIITLAKVGHLDLLEELAADIGIPPAVVIAITTAAVETARDNR